jgi:hypothetical protein
MALDPAELIAEVPARLGLENPSVLTRGGQKIVLAGELAGAPAVAKIVLVRQALRKTLGVPLFQEQLMPNR